MSSATVFEYWKESSQGKYATPDDFQKLFASDMVDLFRLAFLLTANAARAEHCLITTIRECMASGSVYKEWLPVWTRNALIRNGIRIVRDFPANPVPGTLRHRPLRANCRSRKDRIEGSKESAGILQLADFDRLVYVICVLECCPIRDCATLLGRSRQEVREAQERALRQIAVFDEVWLDSRQVASVGLDSLPDQILNGFEASIGNLVA